jgi:DNA-directed RNA polymerase I, II, and III subunit RPABC1
MDPETADILIRSRFTILQILEDRGYDTKAYRNISPTQILELASGSQENKALTIRVNAKPEGVATCADAAVIYQINDRIRTRLGTVMRDLYDQESNADALKSSTDVIIILNEPYNEAFDKVALQMWQTNKARVTFFHIKQVVVHLGRHDLVPPHRKLTPDEARVEIERWRLTQRSQLPLIKHHDIQSRILGLVPGDVVEILRPSATAGINRVLRICAA